MQLVSMKKSWNLIGCFILISTHYSILIAQFSAKSSAIRE